MWSGRVLQNFLDLFILTYRGWRNCSGGVSHDDRGHVQRLATGFGRSRGAGPVAGAEAGQKVQAFQWLGQCRL